MRFPRANLSGASADQGDDDHGAEARRGGVPQAQTGQVVALRVASASESDAARAESTLLGFTVGLLFSDDDLLGRGASRVAETVRRTSRQETLKLLRNGKICYQETVLGGCTSTDGCTASPFQPIPFDCVNSDCVNLVIKPRRLDLAIKSQQAIVARLEGDAPGSVECRIEADNLQALLKARARVGGVAG